MEIRPRIHTFNLEYELLDGENALSIHIIETEEATVQFGAGYESTAEQVVDIATELDVDKVIVEHGDADHFLGVPAMREELDIEVGVPEGDATALKEHGIYPDVEFESDESYWRVRTIDAPGHTPGNMAYLFDDILIAGDTVSGSDLPALAVDEWSGELAIVPPSRNTGGDARAIESIENLLEYDFNVVLLSHGSNVLENGREEVRTLINDLNSGIERTEWD